MEPLSDFETLSPGLRGRREVAFAESALSRRGFLRATSLSTVGWLASRAIAAAEQAKGLPKPTARALIVLWLDGGPSQLETFDPHAGTMIGGPTKAIDTALRGVRIAAELPRLAEKMTDISLIRSMVTKEGDHERARYLLKTGYRPNPSVMYPAIGSICAAHLPEEKVEIPRYVSILSNDRRAGGGYLGEDYNPFQIDDPTGPPRNLDAAVARDRRDRRMAALGVIEKARAGSSAALRNRTQHDVQVRRALAMMDSTQVEAFQVDKEPAAIRAAYGDTPFGRGCLAARRLVEVGVRCVEVQLGGFDLHAKNFSGHTYRNPTLDQAFAALLTDLKERKLLDSTLILCTGEFGRTPKINPADGRDHWNHGFSVALAGGGVKGGRVLGETDPEGGEKPKDPVSVDDLFATLLTAMGIDPALEHRTSFGRPIKLSEGKPLEKLLRA